MKFKNGRITYADALLFINSCGAMLKIAKILCIRVSFIRPYHKWRCTQVKLQYAIVIMLYTHLILPNSISILLGFNVDIINIPELQQCDIVARSFSITDQKSETGLGIV
uniref:Uncharacterized protein n=1 Tax=Glossina palpalis gambiensis TaxID=67801 RepID=A0A1B0ANI0_9MUSC